MKVLLYEVGILLSYEIKLESFEGPLDLLLHLIEKEEMDIYDIQIAKIADQYFQFINTMQMLELEITSEFLVMAAKLLYIKSKMLLPVHPDISLSIDNEDEDDDPRTELIKRLVEYKQYKYLSGELRNKEIARSKIYSRPPIDFTQYISQEKENPVKNISLYNLVDTYEKVLLKVSYQEPLTKIEREDFSLTDKIDQIVQILEDNSGKIYFSSLFKNNSSKNEIVVTLLGVLELMKQNTICCIQYHNFDDIEIHFATTEEEKKVGL